MQKSDSHATCKYTLRIPIWVLSVSLVEICRPLSIVRIEDGKIESLACAQNAYKIYCADSAGTSYRLLFPMQIAC